MPGRCPPVMRSPQNSSSSSPSRTAQARTDAARGRPPSAAGELAEGHRDGSGTALRTDQCHGNALSRIEVGQHLGQFGTPLHLRVVDRSDHFAWLHASRRGRAVRHHPYHSYTRGPAVWTDHGDHPHTQLGAVSVDYVTVVGDELPGDVGDEVAGNREADARCGTAKTLSLWLQRGQGRDADDVA